MFEQLTGPLLFAALLQFVRIFCAIRLTPLSLSGPLPLLPSGGLATALCLFWIPLSPAPVPIPDFLTATLMFGWEALVGSLFGVMAATCWSVFKMGGTLVDIVSHRAPHIEGQGAFGRLHVLLGTGIFLLMGGHRIVFAAIGGSFRLLEPGVILSDQLQGSMLLEMATGFLSGAFSYGVLVAAPSFVAALAANFLIGIGGRLFGDSTGGFDGFPLKAIAVQLTVVGVLWKSVSMGVAFLLESIGALSQG